MEVSVLRVAACAGVLVGLLVLGTGAAGVAVAAPGDDTPSQSDGTPSKAPENEAGEPAPAVDADTERAAGPEGAEGGSGAEGAVAAEPAEGSDNGQTAPAAVVDAGGGSDAVDNNAAKVVPAPLQKEHSFVSYPFPYYLVIRRDGGVWWNANQIIARFLGAPKATPKPEPTPAPAFRGGAPQPEPVLDATGGVTSGGGSDYQVTGFGAAPVISAPIVAAPVLPPASVRFPSLPPASAPAPGVGSAATRPAYAETGSSSGAAQTAGRQGQAPASTVKAMSGQTPQRGYTDYLRSPTVAQLAGAALPGVVGILLLTFGGGVIGYRQAEAGRMIRAGAAARYLP
jgi:hypothetical protein